MSEQRPNPDKLLQRLEVEEEEKEKHPAKLKIYLGAAPGVGKTYEMLRDAKQQREKGLDILIGIVESHGRHDIETMIKDFEILPKKEVIYHNKELLEFDLDAALKRRPALILMDEMAHTNVPGARHKKRWQDIKELLERGIDVYTTLNVQHIESLNDDVAQIIHAPVKETVPDSMIEMASTIELIDIPPEELLKRLSEGKVYIPQQADLAVEHFFKKGNLIALRELALRTVAERVGEQVLLYRQSQGIKHVWPTKEKILVCVGPGVKSLKLIRAARRMATSFQADWVAVFVDTPRIQASENERNNAIQNLRFAEQLGGKTRVLTGFDIVKEIMQFAREQNITQIMVWKDIKSRFLNFFSMDLADNIVRSSGEIDIYIMTGQENSYPSAKAQDEKKFETHFNKYLISFSIVALATGVNFLIFPFLATSNLIMVYLLGITIVALIGSTGSSILASFLSVFAYGFFFVNPFYTFAIFNIENLITLIVMLLVSLTISKLTLLIRQQAKSSRFAEHQTAVLHTLSRQLASTRGANKLLNIGVQYISDMFDCHVNALLPKNDRLILQGENTLNEKELSIAQWVYEMGRMAGLGTDTLSFSEALYMPLLASQVSIGVLRIVPKSKRLLTPEQMHLLESCLSQVALALEVDHIQENKKKKELKFETQRAQNTLLQTVTHDLRNPLIAALAHISTLMETAAELDPKKIKSICQDIYRELEQYSRLINNLLQITHLESTDLKLNKSLTSLPDLINLVVKTSSKKLSKHFAKIDIANNIPLLFFDSVLLQEVLLNLLDNAVKFTNANTLIIIRCYLENNQAVVRFEDQGPGIDADEVNKLFEKFYRGRKLTSEWGLGLGLAICQKIILAHGGKMWAENGPEGGAIFYFTLPLLIDSN